MSPEELLSLVRRRYLDSLDFNGLHLHGDLEASARSAAIDLLQRDLIQVVTSDDYLNIHIRPWPSRRTLKCQVDDLQTLRPNDYGICLYPTGRAMRGVRLPRRLANRPFSTAMARGRATLELAFFRIDVLEQYRNDPRYMFSFSDSGAYMGISDDAYGDLEEPEHDKVSLRHIGFAYDLKHFKIDDPSSQIARRVTAFYGDLVKLSPEHQQRWKTYQVADGDLEPHPLWWGSQMGVWPDGLGPFERMIVELQAINELARRAFDSPLFAIEQRPPDLGWLLRPSQREWDDFIMQLDKLLSDNLRHAFFDETGIPKLNDSSKELGSLVRLQLFMTRNGVGEQSAKDVLKPLREVRRARQKPAHQLRSNVTDRTFVQRQLRVLWSVNTTLVALRRWLQGHPLNHDWTDRHAKMLDYRV